MNLYEQIAKANSEISTIKMTRKEKDKKGEWVDKEVEYCEVKERVIAFRKVYPNGCIATEITQTENYIMAKAVISSGLNINIYNEESRMVENVLASGYARELANKPFALENAETSAIGRALGFCGFGIKTSIASAEEISNIESPSGTFDEDIDYKKKLVEKFLNMDIKKQAEILNMFRVKSPEELKAETLERIIQ